MSFPACFALVPTSASASPQVCVGPLKSMRRRQHTIDGPRRHPIQNHQVNGLHAFNSAPGPPPPLEHRPRIRNRARPVPPARANGTAASCPSHHRTVSTIAASTPDTALRSITASCHPCAASRPAAVSGRSMRACTTRPPCPIVHRLILPLSNPACAACDDAANA
jgi:hypothetical protein